MSSPKKQNVLDFAPNLFGEPQPLPPPGIIVEIHIPDEGYGEYVGTGYITEENYERIKRELEHSEDWQVSTDVTHTHWIQQPTDEDVQFDDGMSIHLEACHLSINDIPLKNHET